MSELALLGSGQGAPGSPVELVRWTYLCVGDQVLDETGSPVDLLKDDETLSSLTNVVRHFLVFAEEEKPGSKEKYWLELKHAQRNDHSLTYSSSSGRSLKTEETESSGVLWYYAMSGCFS